MTSLTEAGNDAARDEPDGYITRGSRASSALAVWHYRAARCTVTRVVPDGCVDIIARRTATAAIEWFVSPLGTGVYQVPARGGERATGIRLRPGAAIDHQRLASWLQTHRFSQLASGDQVDEFCRVSAQLSEALDCLASGLPQVADVARELSVSSRTLQRLVRTGSGRSPHFWLSLARARRAARALPACRALGDLALACGFADQAHMAREMRRWFGATPSAIRADDALQRQLREAGYCSP